MRASTHAKRFLRYRAGPWLLTRLNVFVEWLTRSLAVAVALYALLFALRHLS